MSTARRSRPSKATGTAPKVMATTGLQSSGCDRQPSSQLAQRWHDPRCVLPSWPPTDRVIRDWLADTPIVDAQLALVRESESLASELVTLSHWEHVDELLDLWVERGRRIRELAGRVAEAVDAA